VEEPAEVYHARAGEFLNSHWLGDFRRCPLLYHRQHQGLVPTGDKRPAYLVGSAAHTVILKGEEAFYRRYAVRRGQQGPAGVGGGTRQAGADAAAV